MQSGDGFGSAWNSCDLKNRSAEMMHDGGVTSRRLHGPGRDCRDARSDKGIRCHRYEGVCRRFPGRSRLNHPEGEAMSARKPESKPRPHHQFRHISILSLTHCTSALASVIRPAYSDISVLCHVTFILSLFMCPHYAWSCYVYPPDVKDPCATMRCSFGAQCMASYDGLTARCQCIERCDNYGDSVGSTPVCGTDGKDYPNECEMKRAACHQMVDIEVKYPGKCDPCNGHVCDRYHICQLDNKRRPQCRCNDRCPMELSPVCGSDGKTYSSQCHLEVEACRTRRIVEVRHHGDCRLGPNPCARLRCSYGEECHVDRSGEARCICPPSCEPVQKPVCGSDGVTYDNECELHRQACLSKSIVTVSQRGRCDINSPCADYKCDFGAVCAVIDNKASCQCPSCGKEYSPVCGSDNVTYNNDCELRAAGCIRQQEISIQKKGPCIDVCSGVKCNFYGICEDDGFGNPTCVCSTYCVEMDKPVCGTDGVTYANECQLKVASCQKQQFIMVASEGHCDDSWVKRKSTTQRRQYVTPPY